MKFKQIIKANALSLAAWKSNRHIIVVESDDWGSIRMPSNSVYRYLIDKGVKLSKFGYEKVDTIASREDLELLFETCETIRDINGRPLVITANAVMANPDFEKIENSEFEEYFWEPITSTMERYYPNCSPFSLWKEGIERGVFHPQLHGREHINVPMWLNSLRRDHPGARDSFNKGVFSFIVDESLDSRKKNTSAFNYKDNSELEFDKQSIRDGAAIFEDLFKYKSKSFIAPAYCWDFELEKTMKEVGIRYIQGECKLDRHKAIRFNTLGKMNSIGQIYLNRNANFEYSQNSQFNYIKDCLRRIEIAFRFNVPVTISAHRLNFIGALVKENRNENLKRFRLLFDMILKQWPDVEFMTSDELGELIEKEK